MHVTTRRTAAEIALKSAKRLWTLLMSSDRAELVEAGERLARAAAELRRAMTVTDKAQASKQVRQALGQLMDAAKAAAALLSDSGGANPATRVEGRGSPTEPQPVVTAQPVEDDVFDWEPVPSRDF